MRRPLFPRKQTWTGPARAGKLGEFQRFSPGGLFGLSFNFLRMNQLETELNLAEIAFLLGYANQPAFNLAFKRWNGKPPNEMRALGVRLTRKRK